MNTQNFNLKMICKNIKRFAFFAWAMLSVIWISGCFASSASEEVPVRNPPTIAPTPTPTVAPTNNETAKKKSVKFSSAYTRLNKKSCRPTVKMSQNRDVSYLCKGYKDYKIFVSSHGIARFYIGREISADLESWSDLDLPSFHFNSGFNQVIEWRLAHNEPFACIVREIYDGKLIDPDATGGVNNLVARSLYSYPNIDLTIDTLTVRNANSEIRRQLDDAYMKSNQ